MLSFFSRATPHTPNRVRQGGAVIRNDVEKRLYRAQCNNPSRRGMIHVFLLNASGEVKFFCPEKRCWGFKWQVLGRSHNLLFRQDVYIFWVLSSLCYVLY
jgi:hypothetical protein